MAVATELLSWWMVAVGVWMASLSAWSWHDLAVAAGCAVPTAVAAAGARRAVAGAWRPPVDLLRWLVVLPASVVADAARVLTLPLRPAAAHEATFRTVDLRAAGASSAAAGRRAAATLLLCATPASYVVSTDPDDGTALIHVLGPAARMEQAVTR